MNSPGLHKIDRQIKDCLTFLFNLELKSVLDIKKKERNVWSGHLAGLQGALVLVGGRGERIEYNEAFPL